MEGAVRSRTYVFSSQKRPALSDGHFWPSVHTCRRDQAETSSNPTKSPAFRFFSTMLLPYLVVYSSGFGQYYRANRSYWHFYRG